MPLKDMYEYCGQCGFLYARVDTEAWGKNSARRIMCPVCGWTAYEEINWEGNEPELVTRSVAKGYGAFRLIPPGGYSGYNSFNKSPAIEVLATLKELLSTKGWKGYISLWSDKENKAFLVFGSPLHKFDVLERKEQPPPEESPAMTFASCASTATFNWTKPTRSELSGD